MKTFKPVELLRFITILPLAIVLMAMVMDLSASSEGGSVYLYADTSESTAIVEPILVKQELSTKFAINN
jgi:hypothetical protein